MWLIARYQPTTLFSLKPAWVTSTGGKSLLLPTPFSIKMALLDAIYRVEGAGTAKTIWPEIRSATVALQGPEQIVVINTFTRILKPRRNPALPGTAHAGPLQKSIGYREYVQFEGVIGIGLGLEDEKNMERLINGLLQINYLGKRGGFVQLLTRPEIVTDLPLGFISVPGMAGAEGFSINGVLQQLDDCGPKMTFDHANIYSGKGIKLGQERILRHVVLPYRLVRSSKSYSYYERIDN